MSNWFTPVRLSQLEDGNLPALEEWYYAPKFLDEWYTSFVTEAFAAQYTIGISEYNDNYRSEDTAGNIVFNNLIDDLQDLLTTNPTGLLQRLQSLIYQYIQRILYPGASAYAYEQYEASLVAEEGSDGDIFDGKDPSTSEPSTIGGLSLFTGLPEVFDEEVTDNRIYLYSQPNIDVITTTDNVSPTGMIFVNALETNTFTVSIPYKSLGLNRLDVESEYKTKFREF